jgi:hypothetical protein
LWGERRKKNAGRRFGYEPAKILLGADCYLIAVWDGWRKIRRTGRNDGFRAARPVLRPFEAKNAKVNSVNIDVVLSL